MMPEVFHSAFLYRKGGLQKGYSLSGDLRMLLRMLVFELIAWY